MPPETVERLGVCNLCEAICGLVVTLERTEDAVRVTDVRGNPDDPLSRGHICPKAVALQDIHEDPDRLRRPVRRVSTGSTTRWEESAGTRRSTWWRPASRRRSTSTAATRSGSIWATPTCTAWAR